LGEINKINQYFYSSRIN